jgi:hypothetical protein
LLELETTSEQFLRHLMVLRGSIKR